VVIGAGPTGVEMAGQITELPHRSLKRNFRQIDPATLRVLLFDAGPAVLATFGAKLSDVAERSLNRIGVEVRTTSRVTDVSHREITVEGPDGSETIPCRVKVWGRRGDGVAARPHAGRGVGCRVAAAWMPDYIKRRVTSNGESKPFKYRDLGSMASIARFSAVVDFKGIRVSGFIGWLMWVVVHLTFLTGFKNSSRFSSG
jgi:NADH:ubiquinone reductase (H+-translocating)